MTYKKNSVTVGFPHRAQAFGGPGSFQIRLISELKTHGFEIVYPNSKTRPTVILIVGGTVRLDWLLWCRARGSRIVHRLDGINWRHRVLDCSLRYKLRSETRNGLIRVARNYLADEIIYQSYFVKNWWETSYGRPNVNTAVIYNSVDIGDFRPKTSCTHGPPLLICAEARLVDDHISQETIKHVAKSLYGEGIIKGIRIVGELGESDRSALSGIPGVEVLGSVPRESMPAILREADIFLNLDVNAACPNAVIEALSSGLPVVGYKTGALPELVPPEAGMLVAYGGDPWKADKPDLMGLSDAIRNVVSNLDQFSRAARRVAEAKYDVRQMTDTYMKVMYR